MQKTGLVISECQNLLCQQPKALSLEGAFVEDRYDDEFYMST